MKGWTSLVVLAAVLISAAAWWVESSREEESAKLQEETGSLHALKMEVSEDDSFSQDPAVENAEIDASSADHSSPTIRRETAEGVERVFPGPTADFLVEVHARQAYYYRAPASADLEMEITYAEGPYQQFEDPNPSDLRVGVLKTDSEGIGSVSLTLPADEDGRWKKGTLFFKTLSPGWQNPLPNQANVFRLGIHPNIESPRTVEMVVHPGARIPVRAIGDLSNDAGFDARLRLTLEDLESGETSGAYFFLHPDGEDKTHLAFISVKRAGRYRILVQGSDGVGTQRSIYLDPTSPPEEIAILVQPFGIIEGSIQVPEGFRARDITINAVHSADAEVPGPGDVASDPDAFPPRTARAKVNADGRFRITGLAPGSYRLAWGGSTVNVDWEQQWLDLDSVPTGTKDLNLILPISLMVIRLISQDGLLLPTYGKASPTLEVHKEAQHRGGNSYAVTPVRHGETEAYPLIPGHRYRVLVWGPRIGVHERLVTSLPSESPWPLDLQVSSTETGMLTWTGPAAKIDYEVRSLEMGQVIYSWNNKWVRSNPMEVELPVGSYLFRAFGRNFTGNHGEVGKFRSPFGVEEHRIEILPGQTTSLTLNPPKNGSLEIQLDAEGQPDERQYDYPHTDLPSDVVLEHMHPWGAITCVLRSKSDGTAVGLRFQDYETGMTVRSYTLRLGKSEIPLQTFPPGDYILETRVPGFPMQTQEIVIEAEKRTKVEVVVHNP